MLCNFKNIVVNVHAKSEFANRNKMLSTLSNVTCEGYFNAEI